MQKCEIKMPPKIFFSSTAKLKFFDQKAKLKCREEKTHLWKKNASKCIFYVLLSYHVPGTQIMNTTLFLNQKDVSLVFSILLKIYLSLPLGSYFYRSS